MKRTGSISGSSVPQIVAMHIVSSIGRIATRDHACIDPKMIANIGSAQNTAPVTGRGPGSVALVWARAPAEAASRIKPAPETIENILVVMSASWCS